MGRGKGPETAYVTGASGVHGYRGAHSSGFERRHSVPDEAALQIVTHQTTEAEHTEPPERIKTHKVCSFVVWKSVRP